MQAWLLPLTSLPPISWLHDGFSRLQWQTSGALLEEVPGREKRSL